MRRSCAFTCDLLLGTGFLVVVLKCFWFDWTGFWDAAPYPLYLYIVSQYTLLAFIVRLQYTTEVRAKSHCIMSCIAILSVILNLFIGTYWYLRSGSDTVQFNLGQTYQTLTMILLLIPATMLVFMVILIMKVVCHQLFDAKRRRKQNSFNSMNEEESDGQEVDDIVGVYLRAMQPVCYRNFSDNEEPVPAEFRSMALQKQCRMCLNYF